MLDYAANALAYWPASQIQSMFEQASSNRGEDPDLELSKFISEITDSEGSPLSSKSFWQSVEHNLKAGQSRMIFVADAIRPELQRSSSF